MSKEQELKPCPFCGELPEVDEIRWKDANMNGNFIIFHRPHPICPLSGQTLRRFHTKEKAIEHWNLRHAEAGKEQGVNTQSEDGFGIFELVEHNSDDQMNYSGNDDTRKHLTVGKTYGGYKEIHSFNTHILIGGHKFNSVCFKEVEASREPLSEKEAKKIVDNLPARCCECGRPDSDEIIKAICSKFAIPKVVKWPEKRIPQDTGSMIEKHNCELYNEGLADAIAAHEAGMGVEDIESKILAILNNLVGAKVIGLIGKRRLAYAIANAILGKWEGK